MSKHCKCKEWEKLNEAHDLFEGVGYEMDFDGFVEWHIWDLYEMIEQRDASVAIDLPCLA